MTFSDKIRALKEFYRKILLAIFILLLLSGCSAKEEVTPNPWLVPFRSRVGSEVSRSQMRAMLNLAYFYRDNGLEVEYLHALTTSVELYAGDIDVTIELLNILIDRVNVSLTEMSARESGLLSMGYDPAGISEDNLPDDPTARRAAVDYLELKAELESQYEEIYRIMSTACGMIPYNVELYYRTADLQFRRAEADGDREKYKDAINFLKRAIASDSSHLESYFLIATSYERLGDDGRALRFWRLFEVIYEIAPETLGEGFINESRVQLHEHALNRIEALSSGTSD